jgi:hypothetical protein
VLGGQDRIFNDGALIVVLLQGLASTAAVRACIFDPNSRMAVFGVLPLVATDAKGSGAGRPPSEPGSPFARTAGHPRCIVIVHRSRQCVVWACSACWSWPGEWTCSGRAWCSRCSSIPHNVPCSKNIVGMGCNCGACCGLGLCASPHLGVDLLAHPIPPALQHHALGWRAALTSVRPSLLA